MTTASAIDVLVVEDDPDLNAVVGALLELEGIGYRPALDGAAALREVASQRPDLVLLDLMLPDMHGLEVCRRIRADEATRALPVVVISAVSEPSIREEARGLGALAYVTKPFDPGALIETVRRYAATGVESRTHGEERAPHPPRRR